MTRLLSFAISVILMIGCASPRPQAQPTAQPEAPVAAASDGPALRGGVLGGTRQSWVSVNGSPSKGVIGEKWGDYEVAFDGDGRARHVELLLRQEQPIAQARDRARLLQPRDGQPVRQYTATAGQTVEVFKSEALAAAFPPEAFGEDEEPGTYIQIAERGSPRTSRVVLALGNNP